MNRLANQNSPYLLQHAGNPVDWYPWGEEAFRAAREQDRPIFLSIGYSTCHWCHVMERECFEDPEVAAVLNAGFVSIKVDREERPDIDEQYMSVAQMLTGRGGWPLTIVMTPERRPFFAATYIPKDSRPGRPGMVDLLPRLEALWRERREEVQASAASILDALRRQQGATEGAALPGAEVLDRAFQAVAAEFDEAHGGFGEAPKFPMPHLLGFLLRYWKRTGQERALRMVEQTLQAMRHGGIFDQVGLGFHRYSTDSRWLLPHFEKMLYDQALLALAYTEAYQATGGALYARTARETLTYVLRDLRCPEGAYCAAEDADSEGEEGRFYLWSTRELETALDPAQFRELALRVPLPPEGSYVQEATGRRTGAHVLHLAPPRPAPGAGEPRRSDPEALLLPEEVRRRLLQARQARPRPLRDDKVLAGWNGLMVAALARAGAVLGEPAWTGAARQAADFLLRHLTNAAGGLLHAWRAGKAAGPAFAEDYAYLTWGLIELYEASFELSYLREACRLTDTLLAGFWEAEAGGGAALYVSPREAETVLVRPRSDHDGALPSATSVSVLNLLRLARIRQSREYEDKALALMRSLAPLLEQHPRAFGFLLWGVDFRLGPACEVVIAGDPDREDTQALAAAARREFLPNRILLLRPQHPAQAAELAALAPFTGSQGGQPRGQSRATASVCRDYACGLPASDVPTLLAQMRASGGPAGAGR